MRFQKSLTVVNALLAQDQIWKTLVGNLSTQDVLFNVITAPLFDDSEQRRSRRIPALAGILKTGPTREILKSKISRSRVVMMETSSLDTTKSVSEPVLIRGFWNLLSDVGSNRNKFF